MKQQRKDLQPFNMARLNEIREVRKKRRRMMRGDSHEVFWSELEAILHTKEQSTKNEWEQLENEFVRGKVWTQPIGNFYYHCTVHEYSYLYVESDGLAVDEHGHERRVHGGRNIQKIKEWYIFPDGSIEMCDKDEKHKLVNNYGHPIYVISLKVSGRGR